MPTSSSPSQAAKLTVALTDQKGNNPQVNLALNGKTIFSAPGKSDALAVVQAVTIAHRFNTWSKLVDKLRALKSMLEPLKDVGFNDLASEVVKSLEEADMDPLAVAETTMLINDPEVMHQIRESEEDIKAGRVHPFDQVKE